MQSISSELDTHYAGTETTIATGWKVTRSDGQVFGFTDHDQDKTISGVVYKAASGYTRDAARTSLGLNVDNSSIMAAFSSGAVTEDDMRAGLWDYATIEIFEFNWADLAQGVRTVRKGRLGRVRSGRLGFEAELLGLSQFLQHPVGRIFSIACDTDLGHATRCQVRLDPAEWAALTPYTVRQAGDAGTGSVVKPSVENGRHFKCTNAGTSDASEPSWDTTIGNTTADGSVIWTAIRALQFSGAVSAVTDRRVFNASALTDPPDGWFDGGVLTFTSGANNGLSREVKSWVNSGGAFQLQVAFPYDVAASDTFTARAGCLKRRTEDCKNKFDNVKNHQGFADVPGMDAVMSDGIPAA